MNILQMSIPAGLLVAAIVIIRAAALNRLPKKMFLVLWGVVLFRLLIPVSIPVNLGIDIDIVNRVLPDTAVLPANENAASVNNPTPVTGDLRVWAGITETAGTAEQSVETVTERSFGAVQAKLIWVAGMLAALVIFAVIYYSNHKWLSSAVPAAGSGFLKEWLAANRLLRPIAVMQSDRIKSPLAAGIIKPRIILPKSMDMNDTQLLNYVLTHEYYHIRRYDALWKLLSVIALCVHWFNPMVWVMFILVNRDLELTCDEMVIRRFGAETKTAYAYTLISMIEQRSKFAPLYNGFSKNAAEERIISIMKTRKTNLISMILAVTLVSTLTVGALATAAAESAENMANMAATEEIAGTFRIIHVPELREGMTAHFIQETDEQRAEREERHANRFEVYREFGLIYDRQTGRLYYNGELVRYFEDLTPVPGFENMAKIGIWHFTEDGTVDIYAIREFTDTMPEPSGLTFHDSVVVGLRRAGQEEFEARDTDRIINPRSHVLFTPGEFEEVDLSGSRAVTVWSTENNITRQISEFPMAHTLIRSNDDAYSANPPIPGGTFMRFNTDGIMTGVEVINGIIGNMEVIEGIIIRMEVTEN